MIGTGRECGTSASSAPSVTIICVAQRLGELDDQLAERAPAHRGLGALQQHEVARGARDARLEISTSGHSTLRVRPSMSLIFGRVAWKSKNSSGSMRAKRVAPSDEPRNCSAADAASPASFQPVNAQTSAGARRPSGRCSQISGCIRFTVHHGFVPSAELPRRSAPRRRRCATMRPGDEVERRLRLHAQGSPHRPHGDAVPRARAARPQRRLPARVFRDADLLAGRFEQR